MSEPGTELAVDGDDRPLTMLALIARAATDPAVDVAKMAALLTMQRELMADQAKQQFNEALARLQTRLPRITKRGRIEYPENKQKGTQKAAIPYALWEDIDAAIRPLLNEEGFSLSYDAPPAPGGGILFTGKLLHVGGHFETATIGPLPLDTSGGKNNLQAGGSTTSYGQRYTTKMLLNLIFEGEDDDGNRGGRELIGFEEMEQLSALITETGSNIDSFCRLMNVEVLADLDKMLYPVALNALMARKAARKATHENP